MVNYEINDKVITMLNINPIDEQLGLLYLLGLEFELDSEKLLGTKFRDEMYKYGFVDKQGKPRYSLFGNSMEDFTKFMDKWMELWPGDPFRNGRIPYAIHGARPQCESRMRTFVRDFYKYCPFYRGKKLGNTKKYQLILIATATYLKYQEANQWAYTKKNVKFIKDNEGSMLASWIDKCRTEKLHMNLLPHSVLDRMI